MEQIAGTIIKKSDLKVEGGNYTFFLQLLDLCRQAGITPNGKYTIHFFEKYDQLVITMEDEIKGPDNDIIDRIPGAYQMAQQLFVTG